MWAVTSSPMWKTLCMTMSLGGFCRRAARWSSKSTDPTMPGQARRFLKWPYSTFVSSWYMMSVAKETFSSSV